MESNLWDHFKDMEEPRRLTHILYEKNCLFCFFCIAAAIMCVRLERIGVETNDPR